MGHGQYAAALGQDVGYMSFGKMNSFIELVSTTPTKDSEGFASTGDTVLANIRAYFEPKNATEKWRGNAAISAEDVRGRGMYMEVLAAKVEGSVY